jgi:hypothetical protein
LVASVQPHHVPLRPTILTNPYSFLPPTVGGAIAPFWSDMMPDLLTMNTNMGSPSVAWGPQGSSWPYAYQHDHELSSAGWPNQYSNASIPSNQPPQQAQALLVSSPNNDAMHQTIEQTVSLDQLSEYVSPPFPGPQLSIV